MTTTLPTATPRQMLAMRRSTRKINIWYGSTRSAKTVGSIMDFLHACATHDGVGALLAIGVTRDTVGRNVFQMIESEAIFASVRPFVRYRQGAATATVFGWPVSVIGASDERAWTKIQGLKVRYALGDEAVSWPKSFFDMLVTRLEMEDSKLLVTCNPGGHRHYLKTEYIDKRHTNPDIHVERMLLEDNPTVPQRFKDMLARTFTGVFYQRMIEARWVAAEGAIYQGWDEATMTTDTLPDNAQVIAVGLDYGTQHPSAGYALAWDGENKRLIIIAEWSPNLVGGTARRLTDSQLADSLTEWLDTLPSRPRYIYADPAGASFREELLQRGIRTTRASNAVVSGIRTVDSLLTNGGLVVHESCQHLTGEIPEYLWDAKAAEGGKDKPVSVNDDHVDALRYTVYSCAHIWRRWLAYAVKD